MKNGSVICALLPTRTCGCFHTEQLKWLKMAVYGRDDWVAVILEQIHSPNVTYEILWLSQPYLFPYPDYNQPNAGQSCDSSFHVVFWGFSRVLCLHRAHSHILELKSKCQKTCCGQLFQTAIFDLVLDNFLYLILYFAVSTFKMTWATKQESDQVLKFIEYTSQDPQQLENK